MSDTTLGIAIHGAGWVAGGHILGWINNPHVEIVSIGDIDLDRATLTGSVLGMTLGSRATPQRDAAAADRLQTAA